MIIELKMLHSINTYSNINKEDWYYEELSKINVLVKYDNLSNKMKNFIFNINESSKRYLIYSGVFINGNIKKYLIKPSIIARFEIDDDNYDFQDGDILYETDELIYINDILIKNDYYSLNSINEIHDNMYFEIKK